MGRIISSFNHCIYFEKFVVSNYGIKTFMGIVKNDLEMFSELENRQEKYTKIFHYTQVMLYSINFINMYQSHQGFLNITVFRSSFIICFLTLLILRVNLFISVVERKSGKIMTNSVLFSLTQTFDTCSITLD